MKLITIFKILGIYFGIVTLLCLYYIFRIIRLVRYRNEYIKNITNREPSKNATIASSYAHYLSEAPIHINTLDICSLYKTTDCQDAYIWTLSNYFRKIRDTFAWPWHAIERLKLFAPIRKISNKFAWVILAPLEMFLAYLLGLFLDTTGIGDKILKFLLDFLNRIFHNIG